MLFRTERAGCLWDEVVKSRADNSNVMVSITKADRHEKRIAGRNLNQDCNSDIRMSRFNRDSGGT